MARSSTSSARGEENWEGTETTGLEMTLSGAGRGLLEQAASNRASEAIARRTVNDIDTTTFAGCGFLCREPGPCAIGVSPVARPELTVLALDCSRSHRSRCFRNLGRCHGQCALGFDEGTRPVGIVEAVDSDTT